MSMVKNTAVEVGPESFPLEKQAADLRPDVTEKAAAEVESVLTKKASSKCSIRIPEEECGQPVYNVKSAERVKFD